nr:hypothetical protein [Aestuariicella hydrocarbonica]
MPDLAYTLSKFPNHYRALYSLIRFDEQRNGSLPQVGSYKYPFTQSVTCYFERAFQFRPDDAKLYQLYGIYFFKKEDYEQAMENFKKSKELSPSPEADYNIGLVYFEMGDLENAKFFAEKAYAADFPIAGLKNKLLDKGIELK